MADNDITRGIKIYLDTTRYSEGINQLVSSTKKYEAELKQLQEAGQGNTAQAQKLEAQIKRNTDTETKYKAALEQQKSVLENLGSATGNQLNALKKFLMAQEKDAIPGTAKHTATLEQLKRVNDQLAISQQRVRGETEKQTTSFLSMSKMKASVVGFFAGIGASISSAIYNFANTTSEFISNSISMSVAADGVRHAFEKIDKPGLLDNLRKNTKNTLSDFNLMKAAVRAEFFKIPLEKLGTLLKFAQLRAQETGQSVDYMTESIVTGLGRKSLKILDNLGLSAAEINEEVAKTGDFMTGVSNIIERELAKSTDDYTAAAMKAAQRTAELENRMVELGDVLRPIKGQYNEMKQSAKIFFADSAIWLAQHKDTIITVISVATGWWALIKLITIAQRTWTATVAIAKTINMAYNAVMLLQAGNAAKGAQAMGILNTMIAKNGVLAKIGTSATYLFAAAKALLTGNIEKARIAMTAFNSSVNLSPLGIITTLIGLAASAMILYYESTKEARTEEAALNNVRNIARARILDEKTNLDLLWKTAENETLSKKKRLEAIQAINKLSPEYLGFIDLETIKTDKARQAKDKYIQVLMAQAMAEAAYKKIVDIQKEIFDKAENSQSWSKMLGLDKLSKIIPGKLNFAQIFSMAELGKAGGDIKNLNEELKNYTNIYQNAKKMLPVSSQDSDFTTPKPKKDKTDYNAIALKDLDTVHEAELNKIKLAGQEQQKTEDEINSLVLASDILYYNKRIAALEKFSATTKDKKKKAEYDNEIVNLKTKKINAEIEEEKNKVTAIDKIHKENLDDQEKIYKQYQAILEDKLSKKQITQEQFDIIMLSLNIANTDNRLKVEKQYLNDVNDLNLKNGTLKADAVKKANDAVIAADLANAKARAAQEEKLNDLTKDFKKDYGVTNLLDETKLELKILENKYQAIKEMMEKSGKDTTDITSAYAAAQIKITKDAETKKANIKEKYGLASFQEQFQIQMDALKKEKEEGLISAEDYAKAETNLKLDNWKKQFDYYSNLFGNAITTLQDAEVSNMEAKYDVEIEAAQGNAAEVERLENEKAQKKLDIEKKYADVNFAVKASEIIANTSVAIMMALSQLGVWGGPIAAALMATTGAAQLAAANAERMKIKNMTLSGSTSSTSASSTRVVNSATQGYSEGGYTGDGGRYEIAGAVHRGEYVVPAPEMNNPRVIDSVKVIESVRRQRTRVNPLPGYAEGGYVREQNNISPSQYDEFFQAIKEFRSAVGDLNKPKKNYVLLSDINEQQDLKIKAEKPFTRGDKK